MKEPVAIGKARDLLRHLHGEHAPDAYVTLTTDEGLDLVEFLLGQNPDFGLLAQDADEARRQRDPAIVLQHFELLGLPILISDETVH